MNKAQFELRLSIITIIVIIIFGIIAHIFY